MPKNHAAKIIPVLILSLIGFSGFIFSVRAAVVEKNAQAFEALVAAEMQQETQAPVSVEGQTQAAVPGQQEAGVEQAVPAKTNLAQDFRQKLGKVITETEGPAFEVDNVFRYSPKRDVSAQSGSVGIMHAASEYSYTAKLFGAIPLEFALGSGYIGIQNSSPVTLPAHLTSVALGFEATVPLFVVDNMYLRFGLAPTFNSDNWNFKSLSFNLPSRAFLIYQPSDKWVFVAGIAAFPGHEDVFMPIAGLIYKYNDKLTFNLIPDRPNISYVLNKYITLYAEGGMYSDEFKVKKDDLDGVTLQYEETRAGGGICWSPNKFIDCYLSAGNIFNNTLQYRDSLGKVNVRSGLYTEFRVEIGI